MRRVGLLATRTIQKWNLAVAAQTQIFSHETKVGRSATTKEQQKHVRDMRDAAVVSMWQSVRSGGVDRASLVRGRGSGSSGRGGGRGGGKLSTPSRSRAPPPPGHEAPLLRPSLVRKTLTRVPGVTSGRVLLRFEAMMFSTEQAP